MKNELTAQRLSTALSRRGMNQQQLADLSGVSKHSISQYIHGSHSPSNLSATKISSVLGVNPMWLMGYNVPMISQPDGSVSMDSIKSRVEELAQEYKVLQAYLAADPVTQKHVRLLLGINEEV